MPPRRSSTRRRRELPDLVIRELRLAESVHRNTYEEESFMTGWPRSPRVVGFQYTQVPVFSKEGGPIAPGST
jgi:hypothetical protein